MKSGNKRFLAGAFLLPLLFCTEAAYAHTQLISQNPAGNSVISVLPESVDLAFDEALVLIDNANQVEAFDPQGREVTAGDTQVSNNHVIRKLNASKLPGKYKIHYRVVSQDGHIVENEFTFTLQTKGVVADPSPVTQPSTAASEVTTSSETTPAHEHAEGFFKHHAGHFYLGGTVLILIILWWIYRRNPITSR